MWIMLQIIIYVFYVILFNPLFIGFFGVEKNVNNVLIIDAG